MTHRERVLTLLAGGTPDQVPWFADLDYWITAKVTAGEVDPAFKASKEYIDFHEDLGCGFYLQGFFPFSQKADGYSEETKTTDDGRTHRRIETPVGVLEEHQRYLPTSFSTATTKHLLSTSDDIAAYRYMVEHTEYTADYRWATERSAQIGDRGVLVVYTPRTPFMHLLAVDLGIENLMTLLLETPDEFEALYQAMRRSFDTPARLAAESPADIVMIPENLSAEMVGPTYFETYLRDPQTSWSNAVKDQGKFSCIHMDGTLKGLLHQECSVGLSFIEACTPAPVGDVSVEDWPDYAGTTVLWGGIPGGYFTDSVTDAEFDRHVVSVIEVMRREPRFVLGVADQVPPDGLERRIRRVGELVERHGSYS